MTTKELRTWRAAVNLDQATRLMDQAHDDLYRTRIWPIEVADIEELRRKLVEIRLKLSLHCWPPGLMDES